MKIAIVLNSTWNIVNFRLGLMEALRADGHEIIAIAPKDAHAGRIPFECHDLPMNPNGMNPWQEFKLLLGFLALYRKVRPDVVLHFTPKPNIYGGIAAGLLGIPAVGNVAGLGSMFTSRTAARLLMEQLYRAGFCAAGWIFFQNLDDQAHFLARRMVDPRRVSRVPGSGVDLKRFQPGPPRAASPVVFLLVSRLLWKKGIGDFVSAARIARTRLPEGRIAFRIVGILDARNAEAVPEATLHEWIREGVVEYHGPSDDVRGPMNEADCIVLPSYYREGVPRVLLEAAALAKPVIAYDNIGVRDAVESGVTGTLVATRDVNALAEAMVRMAGLPDDQRALIGAAGRAKVEREFSEERVVDAYRTVLQHLRRS